MTGDDYTGGSIPESKLSILICDNCKHKDYCDRDLNQTKCLLDNIPSGDSLFFNGIPVIPSLDEEEPIYGESLISRFIRLKEKKKLLDKTFKLFYGRY